MNKKIFILLPALALLLGGCNTSKPASSSQSGTPSTSESSGSSEETVAVTSVELNQHEVEVKIGESVTLQATVKPNNATNKKVTWTSSKPAVATVQNGKVTAVAAGETTITVTTEDGNKTDTCVVTVPEATNYGTEDKPLTPTEAYALISDLQHQEFTAKEVWMQGVVFESSWYAPKSQLNGWVQDGEHDKGIQLYGVKLADGLGDFSAKNAMVGYTIKIHGYIEKYGSTAEFTSRTVGEDTIIPEVTVATAPSGDPTGVRLLTQDSEIDVGNNVALDARLVPLSAAGTITFESDTPAVAKIENGKVIGVSAGKAKVKAKCGTLVSEEIEITVKAASYLAKCDFSKKSGGSSSGYTNEWKYGDWSITNANSNNGDWAYVKIGGKQKTQTGTITSPVITEQASKVSVTFAAGSLVTKEGVTIQEWGVKVYNNADLADEHLVETVAGKVSDITAKASTVQFVPNSGNKWAANLYFMAYFTVKNDSSTNGIIFVESVQID